MEQINKNKVDIAQNKKTIGLGIKLLLLTNVVLGGFLIAIVLLTDLKIESSMAECENRLFEKLTLQKAPDVVQLTDVKQ